ncbi:DUF202 domain-containing protein [Thermoanaerobacterium saccharolyticum]|uniref:DUF202 domain-containing protein n=1 Tax=Thermoanaerobacterium saccharolyticum TaxID=28896 RepID=UPI0005EEDEA2
MKNNLIEAVVFLLSIIVILVGFAVVISKKTFNMQLLEKFNESRVMRLIVSLVCTFLAWIMPWFSVKMLLAIAAFGFLISIFPIKKSATHISIAIVVILFGLVALGLIFIPVGLYTYQGIGGVSNSILRIANSFPIDVQSTADNSPRIDGSERIMPDKKISLKNVKNVNITVKGGIELKFTNGDTIYIPSELNVRSDNGDLTVFETSPKQNTTYVVELGTNPHEAVDIRCAGIEITGSGSFNNFSLNSAGSLINGNIFSDNDVYLNCAGLRLTGNLKGKILNINSAGTALNGELNFNKIVVNSTGLSVNTRSSFDEFNVNSSGLFGKIEILNSSNKSGSLSVSSTGGSLTVVNKNKAPININTSGFIKITRE